MTLKNIVDKNTNIVFFGGAGVSTESDIPDFRSSAGLYSQKSKYPYPPEIMLSHSFLMDHTEDFFDYYRKHMIYQHARPNSAHEALAELEKMGKLNCVITQNIDGLHQRAGSKSVIELHGSVYKNYCMGCHRVFDLDYILESPTTVPKCDACGHTVRPDVVLYEEALEPSKMIQAVEAIKAADVLIVGGTSLVVYPAAHFVEYYQGEHLVIINNDATPYDHHADLVIHDAIGNVLKEVL